MHVKIVLKNERSIGGTPRKAGTVMLEGRTPAWLTIDDMHSLLKRGRLDAEMVSAEPPVIEEVIEGSSEKPVPSVKTGKPKKR